MINDLKKVKLRKWSKLSKTENPIVIWCKDQHPCRVVVPGGGGEEEEKEEKKKNNKKEKRKDDDDDYNNNNLSFSIYVS